MPAQNVDERTIEILASIFSAVQGVWAHSQYIMRDGGVYPSESHAARRECSLSFHQRGVLGVIRAPAIAGALLRHRTYPCTMGVWIVATRPERPPSDECWRVCACPNLAMRTLLVFKLNYAPLGAGGVHVGGRFGSTVGPVMGCHRRPSAYGFRPPKGGPPSRSGVVLA